MQNHGVGKPISSAPFDSAGGGGAGSSYVPPAPFPIAPIVPAPLPPAAQAPVEQQDPLEALRKQLHAMYLTAAGDITKYVHPMPIPYAALKAQYKDVPVYLFAVRQLEALQGMLAQSPLDLTCMADLLTKSLSEDYRLGYDSKLDYYAHEVALKQGGLKRAGFGILCSRMLERIEAFQNARSRPYFESDAVRELVEWMQDKLGVYLEKLIGYKTHVQFEEIEKYTYWYAFRIGYKTSAGPTPDHDWRALVEAVYYQDGKEGSQKKTRFELSGPLYHNAEAQGYQHMKNNCTYGQYRIMHRAYAAKVDLWTGKDKPPLSMDNIMAAKVLSAHQVHDALKTIDSKAKVAKFQTFIDALYNVWARREETDAARAAGFFAVACDLLMKVNATLPLLPDVPVPVPVPVSSSSSNWLGGMFAWGARPKAAEPAPVAAAAPSAPARESASTIHDLFNRYSSTLISPTQIYLYGLAMYCRDHWIAQVAHLQEGLQRDDMRPVRANRVCWQFRGFEDLLKSCRAGGGDGAGAGQGASAAGDGSDDIETPTHLLNSMEALAADPTETDYQALVAGFARLKTDHGCDKALREFQRIFDDLVQVDVRYQTARAQMMSDSGAVQSAAALTPKAAAGR